MNNRSDADSSATNIHGTHTRQRVKKIKRTNTFANAVARQSQETRGARYSHQMFHGGPMSLELPADLTPYLETYNQKNGPGCYVLELERPTSLADAWDNEYDHRPPYWHDLVTADRVFYVGAATNLLSRLEDHRNGEVRLTALTRVCEIQGLHTAWPFESKEDAFKMESRIARELQRLMPECFVHQR